ncbi:exodeoxyribonuclease III [Candidatus Saccharibacteria bacterium]|nr:exodeoxyribonuclease III [Candidatus Saccharibacteria bacterium]
MVDSNKLTIYSWNVNGLRAVIRKGALQQFLKDQNPDILCLQEIKCKPSQLNLFEMDALKDYQIFWRPAERPGYSGTAILVRYGLESSFELIKENSTGFPQAKKNDFVKLASTEGRILILDLGMFYLVNVYTPNSKPNLSRLALRHDSWDPEFKNLLKTLEKEKPVVACGDFNCAHTEIDLARPKTNYKNAGFTAEEREGLTSLIRAGFLDTFRLKCPNAKRYTWWSHWGHARENNVGWRIDYFFASKALQKNLQSAEIHETIQGSDHCPVSVVINLTTKKGANAN